jgi:hypothetical protein
MPVYLPVKSRSRKSTQEGQYALHFNITISTPMEYLGLGPAVTLFTILGTSV